MDMMLFWAPKVWDLAKAARTRRSLPENELNRIPKKKVGILTSCNEQNGRYPYRKVHLPETQQVQPMPAKSLRSTEVHCIPKR